jgi:hypothetical protein
LLSAIDESGTELRMVAMEGVFDESLSGQLLKATEEMKLVRKQITTLRNRVTRAGGHTKKKRSRKER